VAVVRHEALKQPTKKTPEPQPDRNIRRWRAARPTLVPELVDHHVDQEHGRIESPVSALFLSLLLENRSYTALMRPIGICRKSYPQNAIVPRPFPRARAGISQNPEVLDLQLGVRAGFERTGALKIFPLKACFSQTKSVSKG